MQCHAANSVSETDRSSLPPRSKLRPSHRPTQFVRLSPPDLRRSHALAPFHGFGFGAASLANQRFERIAVVADFIKERKDRRVVRHKPRCKFSCSGRVTEAAENFTAAVVRRVQQRTASFCLVARNPQVSAVVREMCSFAFNIQLPSPHVLAWIETEIISRDFFKENVSVRAAID